MIANPYRYLVGPSINSHLKFFRKTNVVDLTWNFTLKLALEMLEILEHNVMNVVEKFDVT